MSFYKQPTIDQFDDVAYHQPPRKYGNLGGYKARNEPNPGVGSGSEQKTAVGALNKPQRDICELSSRLTRDARFAKTMKRGDNFEHPGYGKMLSSLVMKYGSLENIPDSMKKIIGKAGKRIDES